MVVHAGRKVAIGASLLRNKKNTTTLPKATTTLLKQQPHYILTQSEQSTRLLYSLYFCTNVAYLLISHELL